MIQLCLSFVEVGLVFTSRWVLLGPWSGFWAWDWWILDWVTFPYNVILWSSRSSKEGFLSSLPNPTCPERVSYTMFCKWSTNVGRVKSQYTSPAFPKNGYFFLLLVFFLCHWGPPLPYWVETHKNSYTSASSNSRTTMGQTMEKPREQPGKTVPLEFPRAQPKGTPKGQSSRVS